jgi:hypothetical protein
MYPFLLYINQNPIQHHVPEADHFQRKEFLFQKRIHFSRMRNARSYYRHPGCAIPETSFYLLNSGRFITFGF